MPVLLEQDRFYVLTDDGPHRPVTRRVGEILSGVGPMNPFEGR
ncbi:hypothetical protein AB3X52_13185 [Nocardioides sp. DS6]|uniref:Uncharacterized protein n=1 Tax=Nocardioides eburneus TaxID=3231482 RepID=A0ABV3T3Y0_9ACTN